MLIQACSPHLQRELRKTSWTRGRDKFPPVTHHTNPLQKSFQSLLKAPTSNQKPAHMTLIRRGQALPCRNDTMWNIVDHPDLLLRQLPATPPTSMEN
jgi:hypothetical protein